MGPKLALLAMSVAIYTTDPSNPDFPIQPSAIQQTNDGSTQAVQLEYNPSQEFQEMEGFGASLTDSSVINFNKLNQEQRMWLLNKLFHPTTGFNVNYLRVPIGASDYGVDEYTYSDLPEGEEDLSLSRFDFSRAEPGVALLKEIQQVNPNLRIMLSPWSPPPWMKEPYGIRGGQLKPQYFDVYSRYLIKTIQAYKDRGIEIDSVTIQNEPWFANDKYPSAEMSLENQITFIRDFFGPQLRATGLSTRIFGLDHNYPLRAEADEIFRQTNGYVVGTAFHCYGGGWWEMEGSLGPIYQTECSGIEDSPYQDALHWWVQSMVIGSGHIGNKMSLGWNLLLDANNGPFIGYCEICRGLVDIKDDGSFALNAELVAMAHAGKFLKVGAKRIWTPMVPTDEYSYIGFKNADGSVVLVVENNSDAVKIYSVMDFAGANYEFEIPAHGVSSIVVNSNYLARSFSPFSSTSGLH